MQYKNDTLSAAERANTALQYAKYLSLSLNSSLVIYHDIVVWPMYLMPVRSVVHTPTMGQCSSVPVKVHHVRHHNITSSLVQIIISTCITLKAVSLLTSRPSLLVMLAGVCWMLPSGLSLLYY